MPEIGDDEDLEATAHIRYGASGSSRSVALPPIAHAFTHFRLTLNVTHLVADQVEPRAMQPGAMWIARSELAKAALPKPMSKLLACFQIQL